VALLVGGYLVAAVITAGADGPPPVGRVVWTELACALPGLVALAARQARGRLTRADLFLCALPLALMVGTIGSAQVAQAVMQENLRTHACFLRQYAVREYCRTVRSRFRRGGRRSPRCAPPAGSRPLSPLAAPTERSTVAGRTAASFVERGEMACRVHGRPQVLSVGSRSLTLPTSPPVRLPAEVL